MKSIVNKIGAILESRYILPVCLVLAAVLRVGWIVLIDNNQTNDFAWYFDRGWSIADGNGFSNEWGPTAFFPVGYPAFLAIVNLIFGPSVTIAKLANIGLYLGIIVFAYLLTREMFGSRKAAGLTAIALAVHPNHVFYSAVLISETLFTFLVIFGVWLIYRAKTRPWVIIIAGLVFGYSALTRQQGLGLSAIVFILLMRQEWTSGSRRLWIRQFILLHVGVAMLLVPWTIRNYMVFDHFVLISTNTGINLFIGNNPNSTGTFDRNPEVMEIFAQGNNEWERDQISRRHALQFITEHPLHALKLLPLKLFRLYSSDDDSFNWIENGMPAGTRFSELRFVSKNYYRVLMLVFAVVMCSYCRQRIRGNKIPLPTLGLWLIVYWTLGCLVTFGGNRFHYPMIPWILMYIAGAVVHAPVFGSKIRELSETTVQKEEAPVS